MNGIDKINKDRKIAINSSTISCICRSAEVPLPHHLPDPGQLVGDPGVHPGAVLPSAAQTPAHHAHQHVPARGGGGDQGAATVPLILLLQTVFALAVMEYAVGVSKFGKNPMTLLVHQY